MAIAGSQYILDFTAEATANPWSNAAWTNVNGSVQNTSGTGLRSTGFIFSDIKYNTISTSDIIKVKFTISTNPSAFSDPLGAEIIDNTTGQAYIFLCNGTLGALRRRDTSSGIGSTINGSTSFAITAASGDQYELWYDRTDGTVSAVVNDVVVATQTDTTYQSSDLVGALFSNPENNNGRRFGLVGIDYAADGYIVDSYPTSVRSGETGVAYTTTGLTTVTAITIGNVSATSISDTAGVGTHSVPNLQDEVAYELYGAGKTVTIVGTEGSPTTTTELLPLATQSYVTLSGTLNTTETGVLYNFSPAAAVGDQIVWDTDKGTVDAQGNFTSDYNGTQTMWHIDATDNVARSYDVITGVAYRLKYWNGSVWQAKPLKYWNGTTWVEKELKYWDGTDWS